MKVDTVVQEKDNYNSKTLGKRVKEKISPLFQKHRKKKIVLLILASVALISIRALNSQEGGVLVNIAEAVESSFEENIFATGKLEVRDKQEFYADDNTIITDVMVDAGQKVKKGQTILRMDDSNLTVEASQNRLACDDIRAKIVNSKSNLRLYEQDYGLAQKEYENYKILFAEGAISQKELEEAEKKLNEAKERLIVERDANLPLLEAQLKQAELIYSESLKKLEKTVIISPMDGVLLNLPVKKGQKVEVGKLLAQIGNSDNLYIETGINEVDAARLKVGDKVEITNNALLTESLQGTVEYISPIAEAVTTSQGEQNQVKIRITVDTGRGIDQLKPGFNVNLKIILEQKDKAIVVPLEAVVQNAKKELVYVVGQDNIVEEREVRTGLSNELFTEIISGLSVGEKVILNPSEGIQNGVKVIVDAASN
jgi:HlyD family secretion protein